MNFKAKRTKNINSSMIPALSPDGLAGIIPGIDIQNKSFNCCFSTHQVVPPIICFCIKNERIFSSKKDSSVVRKMAESVFTNDCLDCTSFYILHQ